ncbi:hypothetical protein N2152v2_005409 [Parachlorella kessleri]
MLLAPAPQSPPDAHGKAASGQVAVLGAEVPQQQLQHVGPATTQQPDDAPPRTPTDRQQPPCSPGSAEPCTPQQERGEQAQPLEVAVPSGELPALEQQLLDRSHSGAQPPNEPAATGKSKRDYDRWVPQEEAVFYATLKLLAGQKPEKCLGEIAKQLAGKKDYNQVRHFYYRLLKRLNKILGEERRLDSRNSMQVHQAMLKFGELDAVNRGLPKLQRKVGGKHKAAKEAACAIKEERAGHSTAKRCRVADTQPHGVGAGAGPAALEPHNLSARDASGSSGPGLPAGCQEGVSAAALGSTHSQTDNHDGQAALSQGQQQEHMGHPGAGPTEGAEASHTADAAPGAQPPQGQQPQQLCGMQCEGISSAASFRSTSQGPSAAVMGTFLGQVEEKVVLQLLPWDGAMEDAMQAAGSTKSLLSVLRHLAAKWERAMPPEGARAIFVHPSHDCPLISLRGMKWGGSACDPQLQVRDIYLALHCPAPFQLLYSWDVTALPTAVQPVPAPLASARAPQQPLAGMAQLANPQPGPHTSFLQLLTGSIGEPPLAAVPAPQPGQEQPSAECAAAAPSKGQRASKGSSAGTKRGKKAAGQAKQPTQHQQALTGQAAQAALGQLPLNLFSWQHQQPAMLQTQEPHAAQPSGVDTQPAAPRQWRAEAELNAHSLLNFLEAPTCAGFPALELGSPDKPLGQQQDVLPLPHEADFAARGWGSLSPPSNFGLPDGFDPAVLLPKPKAAARQAGPAAAADVGMTGAQSGNSRGGLEHLLGPTDFSQLFATMGMHHAPAAGAAGPAAAGGVPAKAAAVGAKLQGPTAAARSAVDALLGQGGCGAAGAGTALNQNINPNPDSLPFLGERDLDQLTMSFGSLLGVGDAPPSWLQPQGGAQQEQQRRQPGLTEPLLDRPFASLFGKF